VGEYGRLATAGDPARTEKDVGGVVGAVSGVLKPLM
jgi:hypothetical protein